MTETPEPSARQPLPSQAPSRSASRLFAGMVILAFGVLALLHNLGVVHVDHAWRFWPLALIALGLSRLLRPQGAPGRFAGILFVGLGVWFLLTNLGVWHREIGDLWPVLLVLVGLRLVWGSFRGRPRGPATDAASSVSLFSALGGSEQRSSAQDFRRADATAILGGCKLDLRQAAIPDGEAVVDAFALWGGIEILVPRGWNVVVSGTPILGGFENKAEPCTAPDAPRLVVTGMAIMGGIEIKNQEGR